MLHIDGFTILYITLAAISLESLEVATSNLDVIFPDIFKAKKNILYTVCACNISSKIFNQKHRAKWHTYLIFQLRPSQNGYRLKNQRYNNFAEFHKYTLRNHCWFYFFQTKAKPWWKIQLLCFNRSILTERPLSRKWNHLQPRPHSPFLLSFESNPSTSSYSFTETPRIRHTNGIRGCFSIDASVLNTTEGTVIGESTFGRSSKSCCG